MYTSNIKRLYERIPPLPGCTEALAPPIRYISRRGNSRRCRPSEIAGQYGITYSALGRWGCQSASLRNLPLRRRHSSDAQADVLSWMRSVRIIERLTPGPCPTGELSLWAAKRSSPPLTASRIMPDYDSTCSSRNPPAGFHVAARAFRRAGDRDVVVSAGQHGTARVWEPSPASSGEVRSRPMALAIARDSVLFAALRGGEVVLQDEEHLPGQFAGQHGVVGWQAELGLTGAAS